MIIYYATIGNIDSKLCFLKYTPNLFTKSLQCLLKHKHTYYNILK